MYYRYIYIYNNPIYVYVQIKQNKKSSSAENIKNIHCTYVAYINQKTKIKIFRFCFSRHSLKNQILKNPFMKKILSLSDPQTPLPKMRSPTPKIKTKEK